MHKLIIFVLLCVGCSTQSKEQPAPTPMVPIVQICYEVANEATVEELEVEYKAVWAKCQAASDEWYDARREKAKIEDKLNKATTAEESLSLIREYIKIWSIEDRSGDELNKAQSRKAELVELLKKKVK